MWINCLLIFTSWYAGRVVVAEMLGDFLQQWRQSMGENAQ
jgi:hypothetical protein